jgi:uncharacterized protein YndB with AHSA1/START domain
MSMQATEATVRRSVVVNASTEHAFSVFTDGMMNWWDPTHHLLSVECKEMIFEPRVGGNIIDVGVDGSEDRWARVLVYDPPRRVVFSWDISVNWERETDPENCSEVEVTFSEEEPGRTLVVLEHRHIDRHGEGWESMAAAVGSSNGWSLKHYAEVVEASA